MAACEQNVLDIPLSPTMPDADDVVIYTLPDGTSVLRTWATIIAGLVPPDKEIEVTASGGDINNGDTTKVFSDLIGRRIRFFRNLLKQSTVNQGGSYFSWNSATGTLTVVPAAVTLELFQIECY
jgi:hypothetical protein